MIGRLQIKEGAILQLHESHTAFIVEAMLKVFESIGADCVVTSGIDGEHGAKSFHYSGRAIDFRGNHLSDEARAEVMQYAAAELGKDYDVVPSSHGAIHIEYDPK